MRIKDYKTISNIIKNYYKWNKINGEYQVYIDTNIISELSKYFWNENLKKFETNKRVKLNFDNCKFISNCFPKLTDENKQELKSTKV